MRIFYRFELDQNKTFLSKIMKLSQHLFKTGKRRLDESQEIIYSRKYNRAGKVIIIFATTLIFFAITNIVFRMLGTGCPPNMTVAKRFESRLRCWKLLFNMDDS